jgi:hypothetical protein
MYTITSYDVFNGDKTTKRILKPVQVLLKSDIEKYQERLEKRIQARHIEPVQVFVHYKVPISEHVEHKY